MSFKSLKKVPHHLVLAECACVWICDYAIFVILGLGTYTSSCFVAFQPKASSLNKLSCFWNFIVMTSGSLKNYSAFLLSDHFFFFLQCSLILCCLLLFIFLKGFMEVGKLVEHSRNQPSRDNVIHEVNEMGLSLSNLNQLDRKHKKNFLIAFINLIEYSMFELRLTLVLI